MRILFLFLLSFTVFAKNNIPKDKAVGSNFLYSFDTEGNQIIQETVSAWFHTQEKQKTILKQDFGIGYTHSWYLNDENGFEYNYSGSGVSLLSNFRYKDFSMIGSAGIGQVNSRTTPYFLGDMNFNYHYSDNLIFSLETYGDLVNSTDAMIQGIAFTGYALTADYYNEYGGIAANAGQMFFSDDNVRTVGNLKIYADVYDGINVYFRTRQYGDSIPNNGIYWSPEMYSRYGVGVSFRQRYKEALITGFLETGASYANQEWLPANAWRLSVENMPNKYNWVANLAVGSDLNGGNNYQYYYIMANFKYNF